MSIIGIAAVDKNWGIGKDNQLLFHIAEDMKFFKNKTLNTVVCMGHNTLKSFPNGLPLKNRINVVLSQNSNIKNCINVHSIDELLSFINLYTNDAYIIGGGSLYNAMLPYYDKVYITKVDAKKEADTFFPNLDNEKQFKITNKSDIIKTAEYNIQFLEYTRIKNEN